MTSEEDKDKEDTKLAKLDDGKKSAEKQDEKSKRETWTGKLDFIMSALSFAVGMGNLWRFPYLCYRNGGGAFLIPYVIMMILAGFPMMFMEFAFGQYGRLGVVSIWKAVPLFQGLGWAMFFVSFITVIYYNMLNAYCIFYIAASFAKRLPWESCGNVWNTDDCGNTSVILARANCTRYNGTWFNRTCFSAASVGEEVYDQVVSLANNTNETVIKSPSDQYFHRYMLDISDGVDNLGGVRWQLALCSLLVWLIVIVCLSRGIQSSGKATYVTSTFPYIVLIILFVRGITLDGATEGIMYYITPQWHRLAKAKVWGDAAVQVFFSLSCCWGGLITLASYNNFNNNCLRDSIVVATGDCLTSIFGGVVIFAFIGYMAHTLQVPVDKVATQGAGLAFIVYPEAVTTLPISQLWAVLFMLMLFNVGIGTAFALVTTVHTTLLDVFASFLRRGWRPTILLVVICLGCFLLGLPIYTRGGMYVLQLMDSYSATYGLLIIGIGMSAALPWAYGTERFFKDIEMMLGKSPGRFWYICWRFVTPAILVFILLFTFIDFRRTSYADYTLPAWAEVIGWFLVLIEFGCIPGVALYRIFTRHKDIPIRQRIRVLLRPEPDWGPPAEVLNSKPHDRELRELRELRVPLDTIDPTENDLRDPDVEQPTTTIT